MFKRAALSLILIAALGGPNAGAQSRQETPPPTAPTPPPMMSPAPPSRDPTERCRLACAQTYYFCLASDTPDDCPGAWSQCRAACQAAIPRR